VDHGEEAFGELVVSCSDGAVDFQAAKEPFDLVALLVERTVVIDPDAAVCASRNDGFDVPVGKIGPDGIGIVSLVGEERLRCLLWQGNQRAIGLAISRFADCQVEGEWPPSSISQTVKLTGEPAPRAAKSSSTSPPFPPAAETWARTVVLSML
jgi:hypothetical protein